MARYAMSRMIRFHKFGAADVLRCEEQPEQSPAAGEVQIRVEAVGVSWYDVLWRQNTAPSGTPAGGDRPRDGRGGDRGWRRGRGYCRGRPGCQLPGHQCQRPPRVWRCHRAAAYGHYPLSGCTYPDRGQRALHAAADRLFRLRRPPGPRPGRPRWSPTPATARALPSCNWARPRG